ncbi:MAG: uroporphyrinogen-III C-methyltransferase [Gammaproteobacteria bacterium]|nr:uroporphyrinogen-III C-methyltransferase [Gammaproteobacteria bacterium]
MSRDDQHADESADRPAGDPLGLDDDASGQADPPPVRPRGGRAFAGLALLLSLLAVAGTGYVYYEVIERGDVPGLADRVARLQGDVASATERFAEEQRGQAQRRESALQELRAEQRAAVAELRAQQRAALAELREEQRAALQASEATLRQALTDAAQQPPAGVEVWRQAEARYLLRIANHRLELQRDAGGALRLLRRADAVLAELDDPVWYDVRARLAEDINDLENLSRSDLPGLFARLEALKGELDSLPVREPRFRRPPPEPEPAAADDSVWGALTEQLSGLLRIRRLDTTAKPLLAPEEAVYLKLNLHLMLERAQLAAMRREQTLFEESLDAAADWLREYFNADQPPVPGILETLASLRETELLQPLPDISGALAVFERSAPAADSTP